MLHTKTFMIALITAGFLAAPTASAGYPAPPKHPNPPKPYPTYPTCEDIKLKELEVDVKDDGRVKATGTVKGLAKKEKAKITFKAEGTADLKCRNPGGNFPGPHQQGDVTVKVSGWQKVEADKHGKADFHILTNRPVTSKMCKNPFTPVLADLQYDEATVIVETDECKVKFECMFDPALEPGNSASLDDGIECDDGMVIES